MKKQLLVTVDRGETRVAILESEGTPSGASRGRGKKASDDWRVAELYIERRGSRSIVGNVYKGKVDNVLPGLEAAFVDIGLEKNGFLHADDVVFPGVEVARRGRGGRGGKGKRIAELLKPGQEILVQAIKDPLKTKGPRLSMQLSIAGRYLVYVPQGDGVGVSRRLEDKERDRAAPRRRQGGAGRRRRDRPHRGPGGQARGLRARDQVPAQAARRAAAAGQGDPGAGDGVPGGRPVGAGRARHLLGRVRAGDRGRREAAPPARVVLQPHRAGAARAARPLQGRGAAVRALRRGGGDPVGAQAPGGPAERRLPDDRLRRGDDGDRHQLGLVHRPRQGRQARGHDHPDQPRGRRGGGAPAEAARHRRDHRHRLHRHVPRAQPRRGAEGAAQGARRGPHQDLRGRDLAARAGRDDAPERHRRGARDPHQALPHLRGRGRRALRGDGGDRGGPLAARRGRRAAARRRSSSG